MPPKDGLVAILPAKKKAPVGAGIFLGDRLVVTCAHVVNEALDRVKAKGRPAESEKVVVDFQTPDSNPITASVDPVGDAWSDPPADLRKGADICLLQLDSDPPAGTKTAKLGIAAELSGHKFQAAGFPKEWDLDFSKGEIISRDKHDLYVLRPESELFAAAATQKTPTFGDEKRLPGLIASGFSGGPVEVDGFIVGILAQAKSRASDATSYMIPIDFLPPRVTQLAQRFTPSSAVLVKIEQPRPPLEPLVITYLECLGMGQNPSSFSLNRIVFRLSDDEGIRTARQDLTVPAVKPESEHMESVLRRVNKLVLLGAPGIGKSTILRNMEIASYNPASISITDHRLVPIRLELKSYNGESDLVPLLARRVSAVLTRKLKTLSVDPAEAARIMNAWLVEPGSQFLILLDALDEVPAQFHLQIREAIKLLLNYPHRFVISCRASDYDNSLRTLATPFVLMGLQAHEIEAFLLQELGDKARELFDAQIKPDARLMTLASNPLLLEVMISIVQHDPRARLPRNYGRLLKEFVRLMPLRRQREGFPLEVPADIVATALAHLGFEMLGRQSFKASIEDVRQWTIPRGSRDLEVVLKAAKSWRLLSDDGSRDEPVQFIHALFRDYYAASYFDACIRKPGSDFVQVIGERISDSSWHRAIVMLAGISEKSNAIVVSLAENLRTEALSGALFLTGGISFFFGLSKGRVQLLMDCLQSSAAPSDAAGQAVFNALYAVMHSALSLLKAKDPAPGLSARTNASNCCLSAIVALRQIGDQRALSELEEFIALDPMGKETPPRKSPWSRLWRSFTPANLQFITARRAITEIQEKLAAKGKTPATNPPAPS